MRRMPNIDLFGVPVLGTIAFPLSYGLFSLASLLYLLVRLRKGDLVETNEPLPAFFATLLSRNVIFEMHDFPQRYLFMHKLLFRRSRFVIVTNEWKRNKLESQFGIPKEKLIMERNGVDVAQFAAQNRAAARDTLGLPDDMTMVLYTGHLYGWKGVDTLAQAATLLPESQIYIVGGTTHDLAQFKNRHIDVPNLHVVGHRPHAEMSLWQAAADVLVLPNTAKEEISTHYTSPMKLFEYMASERPIVASDVPSIAEALPSDAGYFATPDDPVSFAEVIQQALSDPQVAERTARARAVALEHSWDARATRIMNRVA